MFLSAALVDPAFNHMNDILIRGAYINPYTGSVQFGFVVLNSTLQFTKRLVKHDYRKFSYMQGTWLTGLYS